MKRGLVLEGGGMRGVFTSGVLDYFLDNNIKFDYVIGVSAGALNATRFLSNQPKIAYNVPIKYLNNKNYCSLYSLFKTGNIFGRDLLFNEIPFKTYPLDNDYFKNSKVTFKCVVTNCITGLPEYLEIKDFKEDIKYLMASSSIPFLSSEVMINNVPYLDGGVSDSIPVLKAIEDGCDEVIVVMTRGRNYRKKAFKSYKIARLRHKHEGLINALKERHNNYNNELDKIYALEKEGKIIVIQPDNELGIKRTEKSKKKLENGYKLGYQKAEEIIKKNLY
jgi:predicted patatin/cPLA2 family phospholipase